MASLTEMPSAQSPVVDFHLTLPEKFTEQQLFDVLAGIVKSLNTIAGETMRSGMLTTANPVLGNLLNGMSAIETAVLTAKQLQQQSSSLVSGMPMRPAPRSPFN